jgi:hypothetical protein
MYEGSPDGIGTALGIVNVVRGFSLVRHDPEGSHYIQEGE